MKDAGTEQRKDTDNGEMRRARACPRAMKGNEERKDALSTASFQLLLVSVTLHGPARAVNSERTRTMGRCGGRARGGRAGWFLCQDSGEYDDECAQARGRALRMAGPFLLETKNSRAKVLDEKKYLFSRWGKNREKPHQDSAPCGPGRA